MNITSGSPLWRIVRVAPTSAPTGVRTLAARGTSAPEAKVLTTGPPVVPYASVIGAGLSSTPYYLTTIAIQHISKATYEQMSHGTYTVHTALEIFKFDCNRHLDSVLTFESA